MMQAEKVFSGVARRVCLCWATCLWQAGAPDLRQPGRALGQTHEHHLHLCSQRGHRLLHHREWICTFTPVPALHAVACRSALTVEACACRLLFEICLCIETCN